MTVGWDSQIADLTKSLTSGAPVTFTKDELAHFVNGTAKIYAIRTRLDQVQQGFPGIGGEIYTSYRSPSVAVSLKD